MQQRGGKIAMDALRLALDGMADGGTRPLRAPVPGLRAQLDLARWGFYLVVGLNVMLLMLGAIALGQDARRRRRKTSRHVGATRSSRGPCWSALPS